MKFAKTIVPPEMKGVVFITGYRGKGKTFLAAHIDFPQNIAFFDFDEGKAEGLHNQLGFGYYKPVEENEPLKRADMFISEVSKFPDNKFSVVVIDNISFLEKALQAAVYRDASFYANLYGYTAQDVMRDSYGKARGIVNDLIGDVIAKPLHAKGVRVIVVCSHVKEKYNTPGKQMIQGRDRWQDLSVLTLILIDGDEFPVPSAIVQKEALGGLTIDNDISNEQYAAIMSGEKPSHKIVRRLPARLCRADWQSIRWYLRNPANLKEPLEGEKLKPDEIEPFSEKLSKEQVAYQLLAIEKEKRENEEARAVGVLVLESQENTIKEYIRVNLANDASPAKLAAIRRAIETGELVYNGEVTMSKISEWSQ